MSSWSMPFLRNELMMASSWARVRFLNTCSLVGWAGLGLVLVLVLLVLLFVRLLRRRRLRLLGSLLADFSLSWLWELASMRISPSVLRTGGGRRPASSRHMFFLLSLGGVGVDDEVVFVEG